MRAITAFPARSRSTKEEAIVTSRSIKGNNEKNVLKANAPAHCAPSIRRELLEAETKYRPDPASLLAKPAWQADTLEVAALIDLPWRRVVALGSG